MNALDEKKSAFIGMQEERDQKVREHFLKNFLIDIFYNKPK